VRVGGRGMGGTSSEKGMRWAERKGARAGRRGEREV